jgi:putative ABC transport system permease protein
VNLAAILSFVRLESRGARGRLAFLTGCVALGVAAVVAVAALGDGLQEALRSRSREILGADLLVEGRQPLPEDLDERIEALAPGARRTQSRQLATMVSAGAEDDSRSRLCELDVLDGEFPFYGSLVLEPATPLSQLLDEESIVVAEELAATLRLSIGDEARLGGARYRVAGTVLESPGELDFSLTLGPRVYLSRAGFERAELLGPASRVKHRTLVALPPGGTREDVQRLEDDLEATFDEGDEGPRISVQTDRDAQRGIARGIDRFTKFLGLVALLSLVLGGIGVAQVVRSWLATRALSIAVWKSLGLTPREILLLYLSQVLAGALLGSALGALVGGAAPKLVPLLAPDLVAPGMLAAWPVGALVRGVALGLGIAGLFATVALTALWRVPPALVLRSDVETLPAPRAVRWGTIVLLALGLAGAAWVQGGRLDLALWFSGGTAVLAGLLFAGARGLMRLSGRLPRGRLGPFLAHGLSALARPGAGTVGAVVALGLGTLVVTTLGLVRARLDEALLGALPAHAPSLFLVDVQPDQWAGVQAILDEAGADPVESVPVLQARLGALDGVPVEALVEEGGRRTRWALTREQRLTWREGLPESNTLVAGELWSLPDEPEISLEERYAERLGVGLDSTIELDVQGVPFTVRVTSLRAVEWESLSINFFLVVEPGVLDDAPQMLLASARVAPGEEQNVQDRVAAAFPNVTLIRVRAILEKVAALLERIAVAVEAMGAVTVVAGLAILAGAVGATQLRRAAEVALWKTLGVTRAGVTLLLASEYALTGLLAGALGVLGAWALAEGFLEHVLELETRIAPAGLVMGVAVTVTLTVGAGLLASVRALGVRPGRVLRGD